MVASKTPSIKIYFISVEGVRPTNLKFRISHSQLMLHFKLAKDEIIVVKCGYFDEWSTARINKFQETREIPAFANSDAIERNLSRSDQAAGRAFRGFQRVHIPFVSSFQKRRVHSRDDSYNVCLGSFPLLGYRQNTLSLLDFPAKNARTGKNRETKGKFNFSLSFVRARRQTSYRSDCCRLKVRERSVTEKDFREIPNTERFVVFFLLFVFSLMQRLPLLLQAGEANDKFQV